MEDLEPAAAANLSMEIPLPSLAVLDVVAARLAAQLQPGDVLALHGPMGAGKTTFVQALGRHLGVTEHIVSPTFTLIHDYPSGHPPLVHADLYRLGPEGAASVAEELLSVVEAGRSILAVEWAAYGDYLQGVTTWTLDFTVDAQQERRLTLTPHAS